MFVSREDRIVDRIKDFIKDEDPPKNIYIMLRDERILGFDEYRKMDISGKITPQDAYIDIEIWLASCRAGFHYPFLDRYINFLDAFLSKQGFHYLSFVAPATGLKYAAAAVGYEDYLSIELVNLDTAANNTNLRTIVFEVVGDKLVSGDNKLTQEEYSKILDMFKFQRLFAGHDFNKAYDILTEYYDRDNKSLVKEVARIAMEYYEIFHPYTVCYDMDSWKEIDCWKIKLD